MTAQAFSLIFAAALLAVTAVRFALMQRQIRHVARHRDEVPAAFAEAIDLPAHLKAADYTQARMRLGQWQLVAGALFILLMTLGGGLQVLHDEFATLLTPGTIAHGVALLGGLAVLSALVDLPFSLRRHFVLEKRFGFGRMTPALFVADLLRGALLAALVGGAALAAVLWLMATSGEYWWVWVWLFWLAFNVLAQIAWPTVIAPMFNTFKPLEDGALKARVENLLARCGFRSRGLFVMDGSRRSAHGNAYFTGFGAAKRIVFFDTLLEKLEPQEVEAVLAHELGHFHHRHIYQRLAAAAVMTLALLWVLGWLLTQEWFFAGLGMSANDAASGLALFSLVLPIFTFPLGPLMSHWSRANEFEADRYAATQARADDLVSALVKLYRDNAATLTPDPVYSRFFDSHPPASIRVSRLRALS